MSIKFRWLGNACYEIILPSGKVLMLDPFIDHSPFSPIKCEDVTGADYIVVTHAHFDHCSDVGNLMRRFPRTKVITNKNLADTMPGFFDVDPSSFIPVTPGDVVEFDDVKITALASVHVSQVPNMRANYKRLTGERADPSWSLTELREKIRQASPPPQSTPQTSDVMTKMREAGIVSNEQTNFIIQTADNLTIYVYCAGIEEYLRPQVKESQANIIFMQLAGVSAEKAAECAALSGAGVVIPTHHDIQGLELGHKRAKEMAECLATRSNAHFIDTEPGVWYEIGLTVSEV